MVQIGHY